jgi:hypothetical protein
LRIFLTEGGEQLVDKKERQNAGNADAQHVKQYPERPSVAFESKHKPFEEKHKAIDQVGETRREQDEEGRALLHSQSVLKYNYGHKHARN